MALIKKLSKLGNARAILLTQDTMGLLGLEDEDEIAIEFVGDTMLVRRRHSARPDGIELLAGLERLEDTIELKPEYEHLAEQLRPESRQRLLLHLLHHGPSTAAEITEALGLQRSNVNVTLRKLREHGLVENAGDVGASKYRISADKFQV